MMLQRAIARLWLPMLLAVLVIALDQTTKLLVVRRRPVPQTGEIPLLGPWLAITYLRNTGIAFGLFQGVPQLFTVTSLVIVASALYYYLWHVPETSPWTSVSFGLLIGGALGNVVDRIRLGYVVDWIKTFDGRFPLFNLADSAVVIGVMLLALHTLLDDANRERTVVADTTDAS
jgi:signal peptidase II